MPVTTSYPGLYIEELRSSVNTIAAAPTSITVFVGYTHPYKTQQFLEAIEIFNFTDYQTAFGGLYSNDRIDSHVAYAVQQFFLNGGAQAYVVGLPPLLHLANQAAQAFPVPTATVGSLVFTGLEPIDAAHALQITVGNVSADQLTADLTVTYGTSIVETYRRVSLTPPSGNAIAPNFIGNRLANSSLVSLAPLAAGASYGTFPAAGVFPLAYPTTPAIDPNATAFNSPDFAQVFAADASLDKVPIFNILTIPGVSDAGVWSEAIAFCEAKRAFLIMDAPYSDAADNVSTPNLTPIEQDVTAGLIPTSINAALYFPYLTSIDSLTGNVRHLPPSGFVAGIFARIDNNRGVWKAPAGLEATLNNATGVVPWGKLTDARAGVLNPLGVNCIRTFADSGTVVFGARTTVTANPALQQWRYVPVRRMALFLEQSLLASLGWVVFEPNDEPLWLAITTSISAFMLTLFHQGAFQGSTPSQAFQVKCDSTTTTQTDIDNGIVNILVAFAPLKPAEFVVIQIAQLAGQAQS